MVTGHTVFSQSANDRLPGMNLAFPKRRRQQGALITELMIAMSILVAIMIPFSYSFLKEQELCRIYYYRAIAMEIIDGEMEVLTAGEWRAYSPGVHAYPVKATAAANLPPGRFTLTIQAQRLRLEWRPAGKDKGGLTWREAAIR